MANFKEDYSLPHRSARQKFNWGPRGCEWVVRMRKRGASAGVRFRRSMDLADAVKRNRRIIFLMQPHITARYVTIGLTEKDPNKAGVTLNQPLSDFLVATDDDWGIYAIGLTEFPVANPTRRINWHKVNGMRIVRLGGSGALKKLTFKNILFEM